MSDGPYSRVYWCVLDDEKFEQIYPDDRAFGTWVKLLIQADGAYPAPASIPRNVHGSSLKKLVDAGIVDLVAGDRYRIRGMKAERETRSTAARNAAAVRWHSDRNAPALLAKQNKAEQSRAEHQQSNTRDRNERPTKLSDLLGGIGR